MPNLTQTIAENLGKWMQKAEQLADLFAERSADIDREGRFPFDNFSDLKTAGFLSLTVPAEYGGEGLNLYEFVMLQEQLAKGDAATALSLGWHLGSLLELSENRPWDEKVFRSLCLKVVEEQVLINRAATEPATGSPTRGGMPQTTAVRKGEHWLVSGRKSFTSMAEALDYSLVTARIENTSRKGIFLIDHKLPGVEIEKSWDTISMRGTRSDDLVLNDVRAETSALVEEEGDQTNYTYPKAWLLHIPACYLGIAAAARDYAVAFAKQYRPNSLPGPIKEVPEVQRKTGEMELELYKAREILHAAARRWVGEREKRKEMGPELGAVKHIVTNCANRVVDLAMRITGARSLTRSNPLQQYYRDVRAGLHNPPMDDSVVAVLAKRAFEQE
ncbi:MAG TPA: acyl-CoA dehydrogenase family protein [Bacillales bacterium]|nr:acyl-CoA dehydrogenase family protein [Bacillales bacterium]